MFIKMSGIPINTDTVCYIAPAAEKGLSEVHFISGEVRQMKSEDLKYFYECPTFDAIKKQAEMQASQQQAYQEAMLKQLQQNNSNIVVPKPGVVIR